MKLFIQLVAEKSVKMDRREMWESDLRGTAVNTKPCYKPTDLERHEQKRGGNIGMSSLALLKVRVAYLQCGQSSP